MLARESHPPWWAWIGVGLALVVVLLVGLGQFTGGRTVAQRLAAVHGVTVFYWCLIAAPAAVYPLICWAYWGMIKYKRNVISVILRHPSRMRVYIEAYAPAPQA